MTRMFLSLSAAALLAGASLLSSDAHALSAKEWAQLPTEPAKSCIWTRRIHGWSEVDRKTIILREGASRRFKVQFSAPCHGLRHSFNIQVHQTYSSCLRAGDTIRFYDPFIQSWGLIGSCTIARIDRIIAPQQQSMAE